MCSKKGIVNSVAKLLQTKQLSVGPHSKSYQLDPVVKICAIACISIEITGFWL